MLHGGTTPMQALRFGAQMAAELLGIGDEVETLEQGKSADLVVVAGDPLEDIGALREVRVVVHDGVEVHTPDWVGA
jgi:imidazolonepropionase-like amidohydrolase